MDEYIFHPLFWLLKCLQELGLWQAEAGSQELMSQQVAGAQGKSAATVSQGEKHQAAVSKAEAWLDPKHFQIKGGISQRGLTYYAVSLQETSEMQSCGAFRVIKNLERVCPPGTIILEKHLLKT